MSDQTPSDHAPYGGQPPAGGQPPHSALPPSPHGYGSEGWDLGEAIGYSWRMFAHYRGPLLFLGGLGFLLGMAPTVAGILLQAPGPFLGATSQANESSATAAGSLFALQLVTWIGSALIALALLRAALDIVSGREVTIGSVFTRWNLARLVLTALLAVPIVFVGLLLCILPGIAAAFFLYLAPYFVMDKGLGPVAALRASARVAKANFGTLLLLAVVVFASWMVGFATFGLAAIVLGPMATIAVAHTYRFVQGEPIAQPQPTTP